MSNNSVSETKQKDIQCCSQSNALDRVGWFRPAILWTWDLVKPKEISEIRECLDTGKAFTRYELHSVGEALVRFLESLQDCLKFSNSVNSTMHHGTK